ncbi:hypothetical protein E1B28_007454 [Marasmius oreades]|uniref:C3H1-type domain-containing protein n=1 Tax=Marasmius oreades TaxID=181124 RepID=A0A9P7UTG9_9AGAR|nr:uncharacterized protein E1B28_007454 [Marasmius oreades]KAG7093812.1 hypothetical protein E1B28_007454 [Marasmius oreades]
MNRFRGRNVCLFHILDCCEFGAKCMYSHDKAYLPDKGWWKNEELVEALFQEVLMVRLHIPHGEDERQVVDMIHKLISSSRLNPPRDIDTIRTRGTWGHNLNLLHKAREEGESFVNALVAVATSPGYVMVLSLRCENWIQDNKQFVCTLREKVHIKQVFTAKMALSFMNSRDLWGIFITDFGIADAENSRLLNKIVEYAKAGGLVAVGGLFSRHMSNPRLQLFFRAWGLPWDLGACDGTSATFERNPASEMVQKNPSLPSSSNMKAVHLRGVAKECAVYLSNPCSALPTNDIKRTEEFAVVRTRIGKGYFGYIGGNEEGVSVTILLAMLGLLDDTTENSGLPDLVRGHVQNLLQPRNPLYDDSRRVRRAGRKAWSNTLTEGLLDAGMDRYEIRDLVRAGSGPSFDF